MDGEKKPQPAVWTAKSSIARDWEANPQPRVKPVWANPESAHISDSRALVMPPPSMPRYTDKPQGTTDWWSAKRDDTPLCEDSP